ncbi:FaeA-like protein [Serratia fonticola]|jgi:response regulator of citrate/malate metabolism|uniref:FaeA-like protein n=1 Tax=Serratia fonticola TaxID=47917 RepID=A0A542D978_SERFO|nr:FaeA/PapI family transcriptional regulator [Serratia fonticola]TQI78362.1 FaeA-like protein [Serratia fonticola]TQI99616.1 FaeA-like protein [Serratia fonticola]TVZ69139.1 FaeA-like protein [Serratia fonticola]
MSIAVDIDIIQNTEFNNFLKECKKGLATINRIHQSLLEAASEGLTTRQVSDICDISIYVARHWLARLKEVDIVRSSPVNGKSLRWFIN